MTRILIGADVGGTKTAVAVSDGTTILGRADGPGAALRPGRSLVSAGIISDVVRQALASAGKLRGDVLVIGAAGAGRQPEQEELQHALRTEGLAERVIVMTDIEVALAGAFAGGSGIVISAGTGSVAVGRDGEGRLHRAGGYGWQMGDEGSGYAIGRAALGAISRATDGRSPETQLKRRIFEFTRSTDFDALVRWAATAGPAEVASLAPHVLEVAATGDLVAQGIADYAARELSQLAVHIAPRIGGDAPIPVALSGGLLANPALRKAVLTKLGDESRLAPSEAPVDAVSGALQVAAGVSG